MPRYLSALGFGRPITSTSFHRLAHGAAGSLGLKLANMALVYGATLLLARLLGADGYGAYAFALAWVQLLIVPGLLGMETLAVREVAKGQLAADPALVRGMVIFAGATAGGFSLALAVAAFLALALVPMWPSAELNSALRLAIWLVPLFAATGVLSAAVRGLRQILLAQVPSALITPLALMLALVVAVGLLQKIEFATALWLHILAAGLGVMAAVAIWIRAWPEGLFRRPVRMQVRAWLASAVPFMLIGSSHVINMQMDRVMLGVLMDAQTVGVYAIAARLAALIDLFVLPINLALGPYIAQRFASNDIRQLQSMVTGAARLMLGCAIPAALCMIVLAAWMLGLFGPAFVQGESVLVVLVAGSATSVLAGTAGLVLAMTGHERKAVPSVVASVVLNFVLNLVLIPRYGMMGAAMATVASNLVWKFWVSYHAIRAAGIDPTPLGILAGRGRS